MKHGEGARVLAVGLDAAEPEFVRRMTGRGELPALGRLLAEGSWGRVEAGARVGSGAVWPTFFTGAGAAEHGVYSDWCWQPETMSLARHDASRLAPFWKGLADAGATVGVLDVPFAPLVGLSRGFEISEWGAHDSFEGRMKFGPAGIARLLTEGVAPHPFSSDGRGAARPDDSDGLRKLSAACLEGARLRGELASRLIRETAPDLSVIVFPELHHAAHRLWHTVAPDDDLYARGAPPDSGPAGPISPTLADIMREVDTQIARLMDAAGGDAAVLVFSLHGMRPARGLPAFLAPLLGELGFARTAGWESLSWKGRALSLVSAVKRRAPAGLKKLYHGNLPQSVTLRLAQPTMLPAYDWARTRAFALPTDQHGWVRVNLAGREARGCVPAAGYEDVCREVEEAVRAVRTEDGRPLVGDVVRTAADAGEAMSLRVPDLVVHWHDAAFELPVRVGRLLLEAHPAAAGLTGQHSPEGFCVWKSRGAPPAPDALDATELHRMMIEALNRGRPARDDGDAERAALSPAL